MNPILVTVLREQNCGQNEYGQKEYTVFNYLTTTSLASILGRNSYLDNS